MDWYYAENNDRKGPIAEEQLRALMAAGRVGAETLVWNQTLAEWSPLHATTLATPGAANSTPGPGAEPPLICIITGKPFPRSQMIQTEHGWVSSEGKELYYQALRSGAPLPLAAGIDNARVDGKRVVVPATGAKLPLRCVKTNLPVTDADLKPKVLYWYPPVLVVTIFLSLIIFIILYYILRKKVELCIPISAAGKSIVRKHVLIAWAGVLGGIATMFCAAVTNSSGATVAFVLSGLALLLYGLIHGALKAPYLRVVKLKDGHAWLAGAGPEFLASLPAFR